MEKYGIGQPVRRKEDVRLLVGKGEFTDDIELPDQLYAAFVRSSMANAKITRIDTTAARAMPGVVDVILGEELDAAGMGKMVSEAKFEDRSGRPMSRPLRRILPTDQTRFVGECLAMVVAETSNQARDAAEAIAMNDLITNQVMTLFGTDGWWEMVQRMLSHLGPLVTAGRMVGEYESRFYGPIRGA